MGQYECDDGNTVDGDGCNQNCFREGNAICPNGTSRGICFFPSYQIQYMEGMYRTRAVFNYEVENITGFTNIMKAFIVISNGTSQQLPITSAIATNKSTIEIELNLEDVETVGNEQFLLDMINPLKHISDNSTLNTTVLYSTALPKPKIVKSTASSTIAYSSVGAGVSGSVIGAIVIKSAASSIAVIELGQVISVLSLINVREMPSYTRGMVEASSCTLLNFMPKLFATPMSKRALSDINSDIFLNVISPFLMLMTAIAIFYGVVKLINKSSKCQRCTDKILSIVEYSLFFRILQMCELPIILGVMTQLNKVMLGDVIGGISTALAILFIIGIAIWECTLVIFMHKNRVFLNSELFLRKYGSLYANYKLTGKAIYTPAALMFRKILTCFVVFFNSGTLQCAWLMGLSGGIMLWMVVVRPYKYKVDIWGVIVPELLLILGVLFYMFMQSPTIMVYHIASIDIAVFVCMGSAFAVQIAFMVFHMVRSCKNRKNISIQKVNISFDIDDSIYSKPLKSTSMNNSSSKKSSEMDKTIDDEMEFKTTNKNYANKFKVKL